MLFRSLTFIPVLRKQFCEVLNLNPEDLILPENSEFFPAFGAALSTEENNSFSFEEIIEKNKTIDKTLNENALPALFSNKNEYEQWKQNRNIKRLKFSPLSRGDEQRAKSLYLGIDSGSTTTKIVIIDDTQNIVYQSYANNEGNSLKKVSEGLTEFFNQTKEQNIDAKIVSNLPKLFLANYLRC